MKQEYMDLWLDNDIPMTKRQASSPALFLSHEQSRRVKDKWTTDSRRTLELCEYQPSTSPHAMRHPLGQGFPITCKARAHPPRAMPKLEGLKARILRGQIEGDGR